MKIRVKLTCCNKPLRFAEVVHKTNKHKIVAHIRNRTKNL
ncbi:hypothetical protein RB653_004870 [Dictyostelium firmibasis]|uniref:Ribosomal protein L33 n=1 Tax=Dictyostelium firmibasis TaxID=79012 RepID=A0AAN7YSL5_9MYCE